jgi:hypothetical protein
MIQIYHILFIHLSFDGHLSCFDFPTIMNNACVYIHVQVFLRTPMKRLAGLWGSYVLYFEELPSYLPKQLYHFTIQMTMYRDSSFSTSWQTPFDFGHSGDLDLYFANDWWWGASFHELPGHSYIFFIEMLIHILSIFKLDWFSFLLLSCRSSLDSLDMCSLSDMLFSIFNLF